MILKLYMSVGRLSGVKVKELPVVDEVRVRRSWRSSASPFWRTMVQPPAQPLKVMVKGSPSSREKAELVKEGDWAAARAARARRGVACFMVAAAGG